eukprot:scaffold9430_cov128-Isochrysis_galbana.AAC.5
MEVSPNWEGRRNNRSLVRPKHAPRQGRHKGAGKGTYTSCSEGGGLLRGGLPTPLSGAWGVLPWMGCDHVT